MFERLIERSGAISAARVGRVADRIASAIDLPQGVSLERSARGIVLVGRSLKMRMIRDARLRNFAALAQGMLR